MTAPATLRVNGVAVPLAWDRVAELLADRGIASGTRGVAVAVNGTVIPAAGWQNTPLVAGDTVDIVRAFQGG